MTTQRYYEMGFKNKIWTEKTLISQKRNPIKGYRKTLECCDVGKQKLTLQIIKDNYSKCSDNTICDKKGRTNKPIIRSGMQPKKQKRSPQHVIDDLNTQLTQQQKSTSQDPAKEQELKNKIQLANQIVLTPYSYSYRDYMKNKKNITYSRKATTFDKVAGKKSEWTSGTGDCQDDCNNKTIWKPNNNKFKVQGAVSSSSRLDRLKYDSIISETKCDNGTCNGVYFAGKSRFTGWIFNKNHPEKCCPQEKARRRTMALRKDNNQYGIDKKHMFNSMTQIQKQKKCCQPK